MSGSRVDPNDDLVVLRGVTWVDLERRLAERGECSVPRVHYLDGTLELVTPSREHEGTKSWIGALVAVYAIERGIELSAFGSWTLANQLRRAGAEPDECYILGEDASRKRVRPDLVIEVQWSRRGIDKLEIYKRLGVREVWFWIDDAIAIYVFNRRWRQVERSPSLPDLDLEHLCSFLDRKSMTAAMRDYRASLAGA